MATVSSMRGVGFWIGLMLVVGCNSRADRTAGKPAATATFATANAAYDAKDWARCSDEYLALASRHPDAAADALYNGGCCLARAGLTDQALDALEAAIDAGHGNVDWMQRDLDLALLRADPRWPKLVERARARMPTAPALRSEILQMLDKDQAARRIWIPNQSDVAARNRVTELDRTNTARMKEIVARHGWPGRKLVGWDGSSAAWLLVQHADADHEFQKRCLEKLEIAVAAHDASPANLAYLYDRLAVADGRKQRYGTQFAGNVPMPIEDAAGVDQRRAAVGLGTLAEYQQAMYGGTDRVTK